MAEVYINHHPLVQHKITRLRDKTTGTNEFRSLVEEIGMLMGYEKTGDMAKAFRYGIAAGAASVMTEGTQLIVRSDFEKLLAQVKVQEV